MLRTWYDIADVDDLHGDVIEASEGEIDALELEKMLGALHRVLERAVGLVRARRPLHRHAPLGVTRRRWTERRRRPP